MTEHLSVRTAVPDRISSDNGDCDWFPTEMWSKARSLSEAASECDMRSKDFRAIRRWMRRATMADVNDATIFASHVELGWWLECPRTDPGAFPVWRIDPRA